MNGWSKAAAAGVIAFIFSLSAVSGGSTSTRNSEFTTGRAKIKSIPALERFYKGSLEDAYERGLMANVRVCVDSRGKLVSEPAVTMSSFDNAFDTAAIATAKNGKYTPDPTVAESKPSCVSFRLAASLNVELTKEQKESLEIWAARVQKHLPMLEGDIEIKSVRASEARLVWEKTFWKRSFNDLTAQGLESLFEEVKILEADTFCAVSGANRITRAGLSSLSVYKSADGIPIFGIAVTETSCRAYATRKKEAQRKRESEKKRAAEVEAALADLERARREEVDRQGSNLSKIEVEEERLISERLALQHAAKEAESKILREQALKKALGRRVALVIGNSQYKIGALRNPVNDSQDVAKTLRERGFKVFEFSNVSLGEMRQVIREFRKEIEDSDAALVYFSGHGIELNGRNYFVPVDADIQHDFEVLDQAYDATQITAMLEEAPSADGQRVNILIVDACRNNPLSTSSRNLSRGLARMDAPSGTLIAFATAPGRVASDGAGRNSPFTKHLLDAIKKPNEPIELVFKSVRRAVVEETKGDQVPWENSSLIGDFYFTVQP